MQVFTVFLLIIVFLQGFYLKIKLEKLELLGNFMNNEKSKGILKSIGKLLTVKKNVIANMIYKVDLIIKMDWSELTEGFEKITT